MSGEAPAAKPTYTLMEGDKGWGKPANARRWHFYRGDARSECGRWSAVFAAADSFTEPTGAETPGPDDCAACWEKLWKRPIEPTGGS